MDLPFMFNLLVTSKGAGNCPGGRLNMVLTVHEPEKPKVYVGLVRTGKMPRGRDGGSDRKAAIV